MPSHGGGKRFCVDFVLTPKKPDRGKKGKKDKIGQINWPNQSGICFHSGAPFNLRGKPRKKKRISQQGICPKHFLRARTGVDLSLFIKSPTAAKCGANTRRPHGLKAKIPKFAYVTQLRETSGGLL